MYDSASTMCIKMYQVFNSVHLCMLSIHFLFSCKTYRLALDYIVLYSKHLFSIMYCAMMVGVLIIDIHFLYLI